MSMRVGWLAAAVCLYGAIAGAEEGWSFTNGAEFPGAKGELTTDSSGVMHLRYDFTGGGNYVGAWKELTPPQSLSMVTFRAKKVDEAQLTLRVIDSTGQGLQEPLPYEHSDWQPVEVDMMNFDAHWGGANDGVLHPPVKAFAILVESAGLNQPTGEVLLADVKAHEGNPENENPGGAIQTAYRVTDFGDGSGFSGPIAGGVWSADFSQGASSRIGHSLSVFGNPRQFTLRVSGGKPGNVLKMQFGSHFQTFERTLGTLDGADKTFTFSAPPEGWSFSGGENNGKVRLPLRVSGFTLERGDGPAEPVQLKMIELRAAVDLAPSEVVQTSARLEQGRLTLQAWNLLGKPITGYVSSNVRNWEGERLYRNCVPVTLPPDGELFTLTHDLTLPEQLAFAEAESRWVVYDKSPRVSRAYLTSLPEPYDNPHTAELHPESPWGMGVYIYRYGTPEDMDRVAALAEAAGVKWSREEFSWAATEPNRGEYDFSRYDTIVDTARRHGISVYGLLSYWSNWTKPYTEEGIDDFARWAKAVVTHFKDRVKHWEVYNEPNIFFWEGPKELYPLLVKKCYAAIKEADPEAQVLAVSTSGVDFKFIDLCVKGGAPFDVLTVHPYRASLSERSLIQDLHKASELVGGRPVWITEMGWSTQIGGRSEREQAELLARSYLAAVGSGACANMGWYDFRNDGTDPYFNESNFGVLRADFTPKPAYRALATVCRTMAEGTPRLYDELAPNVYRIEMGNATAVWSPSKNLRLQCRLEGATPRVLNLMGEEVNLSVDQGNAALMLHPGAPLFITGAKLTPVGQPEPVEEDRPRDYAPLRF